MRTWTLAASAATLAGALAIALTPPPAEAFGFGRKKAQPQPAAQSAPASATPSSQTANPAPGRAGMTPEIRMPGDRPEDAAAAGAAAPAAPPAPPATAEQRRAARSLDLMGQARFWSEELGKNPRDAEAALEASIALRRLGRAQPATEAAAMGLQVRAEDPGLWSALALALAAGQQWDPAIQSLRRAIALSPRDPALHSALGMAWDGLERPDMARSAYEEGLRIAPNDPGILTNFGLSKALAGDMAGAEAMLRRAAALPAAPAQARQNLALVVGLQGRFEESERIASADLPPSVAQANVTYLRQLLNGGDSRWTRARAENGG